MQRGGLLSVKLGTRVKSLTINRADVAQGTKGRAVLLDPNPRASYIAYDQDNKVGVYVDQDAMLQYGLNARTYYFLLLARLNTDMQGNQVGDGFVVEYLRLSDKLYEEFMEAYNEIPKVGTIILRKEARTGNNGQDFSYVKPIPSKDMAVPDTYKKIQSMTPEQIEKMWELVQVANAKTLDQYEKLLAEKAAQTANQPTPQDVKRFQASASGTADTNYLPQYATEQSSAVPQREPNIPKSKQLEPDMNPFNGPVNEDFNFGNDDFANDFDN